MENDIAPSETQELAWQSQSQPGAYSPGSLAAYPEALGIEIKPGPFLKPGICLGEVESDSENKTLPTLRGCGYHSQGHERLGQKCF